MEAAAAHQSTKPSLSLDKMPGDLPAGEEGGWGVEIIQGKGRIKSKRTLLGKTWSGYSLNFFKPDRSKCIFNNTKENTKIHWLVEKIGRGRGNIWIPSLLMVEVYEYQPKSPLKSNFWDEKMDLLYFIIKTHENKRKCRWHDQPIASYQNLWNVANRVLRGKVTPSTIRIKHLTQIASSF